MFVIAGLGNPGQGYAHTRHNMGFDTIDELITRHKIPQSGVKFSAMYGKGMIEGQSVILMKPLSYMNLSGGPIQEMTHYWKVDPKTQLVVICDDIDLPPGTIRIRGQGSAGGHNGLKNIIERLGTDGFIRIRIGVGEKRPGQDLADHVLSKPSKEAQKEIDEAIGRAADAVEMILSKGLDAAMNTFNRKKKVEDESTAGTH